MGLTHPAFTVMNSATYSVHPSENNFFFLKLTEIVVWYALQQITLI